MRIITTGDIVRAEDFWDCECDKNFIHRTSTDPVCDICGCNNMDCPDSRLEEIIVYYPLLLTEDERWEAVDYLKRFVPFQ